MPNSVCSIGYGHNAHGVNIQASAGFCVTCRCALSCSVVHQQLPTRICVLMLQNMRGLVNEKGQAEAQLPGGMRTYHSWKFEVGQQHSMHGMQHASDSGWIQRAHKRCVTGTADLVNCSWAAWCTASSSFCCVLQVEQSKRHTDFRGQLGTQLKQSNNAYTVGTLTPCRSAPARLCSTLRLHSAAQLCSLSHRANPLLPPIPWATAAGWSATLHQLLTNISCFLELLRATNRTPKQCSYPVAAFPSAVSCCAGHSRCKRGRWCGPG